MGIRGYWTTRAFTFDGAVTIISVADMAMSMRGQPSQGISVIRILRLFRAMRVIPGLRSVISIIIAAIPATGCVGNWRLRCVPPPTFIHRRTSCRYTMLLFGAFMLLFALLGLHVFGGRYEAAINAGRILETPQVCFSLASCVPQIN